MSNAISPDGRYLAILNGGFLPPAVSVLDLEISRVSSSIPVQDGWKGATFSAAGSRFYAGGGGKPLVTEFQWDSGKLSERRKLNPFPGETAAPGHLISDVVPVDSGKLLAVSDLYTHQIVLLAVESGKPVRSIRTAPSPYALFANGATVLAACWGSGKVHEYRIADGAEVATLDAGPYPAAVTLAKDGWLFVAAANTNHVAVFRKQDSRWVEQERINLALTPRQPAGVTPSDVALSADEKTLYVACSHLNAVAVVDVGRGRSSVTGFIPTGWYPTAVRPVAGGRLVILNGKGLRSYPNPEGPNPATRRPNQPNMQYVGRIQKGAAQIVPAFDREKLREYTRAVLANSPYRDSLLSNAGIPPGSPIPNKPGDPSPIKYVVMLMKENRTYDQVLGDLKEGNGDPSLVLFGEKITPNHHKLAREFALLDNFYVNADVSADGFYWTTAAIAPDHSERSWPIGYARRLLGRPLPAPESNIPAAPGGHIWNRALEAGLWIRNYGFTAVNVEGKAPESGPQIRLVRDKALEPHTSYEFRQHDRTYSDVKRMEVILRDLAQWEKKGEMPRLVLITIGNDHTEGTTPGVPTPAACVADNDHATGVLVEALSKSKFWPSLAIFILEDDAQDGPDHVDSHRSPAFVISPYAKRAIVDSTMYNTTSMLRTMELILGLRPMTVFDAAARPMASLFQAKPDLRPYTSEKPRVSTTELNPPYSPTAARSRQIDFSQSDLAEDRELNDILYLAIQGRPAPAPVRSGFVR
jgi:DNA-binding beta-propeller fold protein YncE